MQQVTVTHITPEIFFSKFDELNKAIEGIKQSQQEKLLSASEACKIFTPAIAKSTLSEWTTQGLIPVYRIGGRVFYKYTEVIEAAKTIKRYDRNKNNTAA